MKKLLLITLFLSIGLFGISQERIVIPKEKRDIAVEVVFENSTDNIVDVEVLPNQYVSSNRELFDEDQVGTTVYDLQSNSMLSNRIFSFNDGSFGTVWTRGIDSAPNFEDRGTGYNFFDGNNQIWMDEPTIRVEDERTGWPSYAPFGEDGEVIVAHLASGLKISTRENKGEGDWNYQTLTGPTNLKWPRMITSGEDNNIIHIIANSYDPYEGQPRALLYYRSQDAGVTWDIEAEVLEGTGADYYTEIDTDSYVWAEENGGAIAFVVGGVWMDLFMMKSTDHGDSWEKTVIWEHPYPFFDWGTTNTDTFYCVDNSASIYLDDIGIAHVTFGINRARYYVGTLGYLYFPFVGGIAYWNENMDTFSNDLNALSPYNDPGSELIEDYSLVGWTQDVNGNGEIDFINWNFETVQQYRQLGVSTMPSIGFSGSCGLLVAFASTTEGYDNGFTNFKHIWTRLKTIDGSWNDFEDFTLNPSHMFEECIYPVVAQQSEEIGVLMYMADTVPGLALDEDHVYDNNRIIVSMFDCIDGLSENIITEFTVSQNAPNPAVNTTRISVKSEEKNIMTLSITNIYGQKVYNEKVENSTFDHTFNLVVSDLEPGLYLYTVEMGNGTVTKKMIVQ